MYNYSWNECQLSVNFVEIDGMADGSGFVKMARRADSFRDKMTGDGKMVVSANTDRSGEITINLEQTSASNKYIAGLLAASEMGVFVPVTVQFADSITGDVGAGSLGYIKKPAEMVRSIDAENQEWVIVVERLDLLFLS